MLQPDRHRVLRIIGFGLVGLALLSFAVRVIERVLTGHSLDTYPSGKLVAWNYGSAFVTLILFVTVGLVIGVAWFVRVRRYRRRLSRELGVSQDSKGRG